MAGLSARKAAGVMTLLAMSTLVVGVPIGAGAQDVSIEVSLDTVVRAPEGTQHSLATETVPPDLVGTRCRVSSVSHNQRSVHPGNDLFVISGGGQLVLEDVEGEAFVERTAEGTLTLGNDVRVLLVMGPDGVFSAGIVVEVRCPSAETTTTTEATTTTTSGDTTTTTTGDTTTTTVEVTTTSTEVTTTTTGDTTTTTTGDTTTTTTGGEATTTTGGEATTTTAGATSTTPDTLPFTGIGPNSIWVGLAALAAGIALMVLPRRGQAGGSAPGSGPYIEVMIEGVRVRLLRPGD